MNITGRDGQLSDHAGVASSGNNASDASVPMLVAILIVSSLLFVLRLAGRTARVN
jgi:hypothetical protein